MTEEPRERVDTWHDETRRAHYQVLVEPAKQLGLDMKLPPAVVPRPYTRLAFEVWYFARKYGLEDAYSDLMYRAYFIEEKDIGDPEVLVSLAERIGLDPEEYRKALLSGTYAKEEKEDVSYSKNVLQVKGIPAIYINGQKAALQTYTKAERVRILTQQEEICGEGGFSCGPDGCN